MKPFSYIFLYCMVTARLAVKVNYILGAQSNGKPNFLLDYPQNFEI